jgi:hypothetical protein
MYGARCGHVRMKTRRAKARAGCCENAWHDS